MVREVTSVAGRAAPSTVAAGAPERIAAGAVHAITIGGDLVEEALEQRLGAHMGLQLARLHTGHLSAVGGDLIGFPLVQCRRTVVPVPIPVPALADARRWGSAPTRFGRIGVGRQQASCDVARVGLLWRTPGRCHRQLPRRFVERLHRRRGRRQRRDDRQRAGSQHGPCQQHRSKHAACSPWISHPRIRHRTVTGAASLVLSADWRTVLSGESSRSSRGIQRSGRFAAFGSASIPRDHWSRCACRLTLQALRHTPWVGSPA